MKRVLFVVLILTLAGVAQTTSNVGLNLPAHASLGWDYKYNANFVALDSLLSGGTALPALKVTGCVSLNNSEGLLCGNGLSFGGTTLNTSGLTLGSLSLGANGTITNGNGFTVSALGATDATAYTIGGNPINFSNLAGAATGAQLPTPGTSTLGALKAKTCTGSDKVSGLGTDGVLVCTADQTTAGGTGITTLNGANGSSQTFVNGANITITTNTGTGAHTIAVSGLASVATVGTYASLTSPPQLANTMANVTHKWLNSYNATTGNFTQTIPSYNDLSDTPTVPTSADWPNAGACAANRFVTALNNGLAATCTQPSSSNLTDAAAIQTRQLTFMQGCDTCSAMIDADDQNDIFVNRLGRTITLQSVYCKSDAGSPTIMLLNGANNILAGNLTCTTSGASTTSFSGSYNQIASGGLVNYQTISAGGAAKRVTVVAVYQ